MYNICKIIIIVLMALLLLILCHPKEINSNPTSSMYQLIELEKQQLREIQQIRMLLERNFR